MLRIALVGAGRPVVIGHAPALQALHDLYKVVAIADQSQDAVDDAGILLGVPPAHRYHDFRDLLANEACDVVSISLPHVFHKEVAQAALDADCHIITERPLALSLTDAREVIHHAETRGKQVTVLHYFLYYPPFREAIRLVSDGVIGEPFLVRCEGVTGGYGPGTASYHPAWHAEPEISGGGVWIDSGYHSAYLCVSLTGSPVTSIAARIATFATDYPVDDTAAVLLQHANGAASSVQVAWSVPSGGQRVLEIYGTKGTIALDQEGYALGIFDNATQTWQFPQIVTKQAESFIEFYRAVYNNLVLGAAPPVSHRDALHALDIVTAGYRASNEHRLVSVTAQGDVSGGEMEQAA